MQRFAETALMDKILTNNSVAKKRTKFILFLFAFLFMILGIANPQIGSKLEEVKREGIDIMIALDVSNSMKAEDLTPNRLQVAKRSIQQLLERLKGDRIGLIVFAGKSFVQLPITTDYAAARLFLNVIDTDIVPIQGTAIGSAINLSMESFDYEKGGNRALIILTDGENHEDDAVSAAEEARKKGIKIYTVGMGTPNGAPIPVFRSGKKIGYRQDNAGNTIISSLNEEMLAEIAAAGGGAYVRANNSGNAVSLIMDEIQSMDKTEFESSMYTDYEDRFQYFIALSLLFYIMYFLMGERKSKWKENLNLFKE